MAGIEPAISGGTRPVHVPTALHDAPPPQPEEYSMIFILANWKWLLGAAASITLSIALLFARADAAHWRKLDTQHVAALNLEIVKHAITRQSLEQALSAIHDQNAAVDALKAESDARTSAAAAALHAAQERAQSAEATAWALEASAAKGAPAGSCKASAAYAAAKGEL
jgi:hypothetical protein